MSFDKLVEEECVAFFGVFAAREILWYNVNIRYLCGYNGFAFGKFRSLANGIYMSSFFDEELFLCLKDAV